MSDSPALTPCAVYLAGELFSAKHLSGNAALAAALRSVSGGRYEPLLPQDFEPRDATPHGIRDEDLRRLLSCDAAVFHYDGTELDSGTVVEFMFAKFADIPAVLLRTDLRSGGEGFATSEPWNLMTSFYPRTRSVILNAMTIYQGCLAAASGDSVRAAAAMTARIALEVVSALDAARDLPPVLPEALREYVFAWLALMPGFHADNAGQIAEVLRERANRI